MVMTAERLSRPRDPEVVDAAAGRESRTQLVHKFSLPIAYAWGSKRLLRFVHVNGKDELPSNGWRSVAVGYRELDTRRPRLRVRDEETVEGGDDRGIEVKKADEGLEEGRANLKTHFREVYPMQLVVRPELRDQEMGSKPLRAPRPDHEQYPSPSSAAKVVRPWNLRTRRAVVREAQLGIQAERGVMSRTVGGRGKRHKFSISLTSDEIMEDIYAVTGSLPRRRPRKRPRVVQKQLDALFPGSLLTEITANSFKVSD